MSNSSIRGRLLHRGLRARVPLYRNPLQKTIDGCVCNGLMSTDPGKLIGPKLSFRMNHASICETMMAAFVLDSMPLNAAFQSTLSNDIVAEHSQLRFGVRFQIMDDPIYYELSVILITTGTFAKCYSPKMSPSFKASLALPFCRIMHANLLQKTIRDFCSDQHTQLLPWPAYSPDMSPIEQAWNLVGWRLAYDLCPAASKDELWLLVQAI